MVSFSEDDYIKELQYDKGQAIWIAHLEQGKCVYQDDYRPGQSHYSAWVRLAEHLRLTGDKIVSMSIKFRSNIFRNIVSKSDGYFFAKSLLAVYGAKDPINFYLIGNLTNGKIMVQKWETPSLLHVETTSRDYAPSINLIEVSRGKGMGESQT